MRKNTKVNKLRAYILNYYPYIEDIVKLQKADAIGTGMAKEEDIPFFIKVCKTRLIFELLVPTRYLLIQ